MSLISLKSTHTRVSLAVAALALSLPAVAAVQVNVTVENLVPANSISFAPLHVGFHSGSFDAFDLGSVAGAGIVSVAESGAGDVWQADFAAADPGATRGTIGGVLLPGQSATLSFVVDPLSNAYFSFAAMALPSNDFFIGNDAPTAYKLFDNAGQLQINSIVQTAAQVWDAGSEVFDPATAAFVGDAGLHAPQGSVVALNFAELAAFNGLNTGAGYVFNSGLAAGDEIYRVSFSVSAVPEPGTYGLMGAGLLSVGWLVRRRKVSMRS